MTTRPASRVIVAANVRALLGWKRITASELAARIGMRQTTISSKLRGRSEFTADELDRVAAVFGLPDASVLFRAPQHFGRPGTDAA